MRIAFAGLGLLACLVAAYVFLQLGVADKVAGSMAAGAFIGAAIVLPASLWGLATGVLRARRSRRPSVVIRAVISASLLWIFGVAVWGVAVDAPDRLSGTQFLSLLLCLPWQLP